MNSIPNQLETPSGLHQRYVIKKIVTVDVINPEGEYSKRRFEGTILKVVPTDEGSEYFVLRLDEGGKDINHIKACRIGVHAYADAIEATIPELAKDLRERYPLL